MCVLTSTACSVRFGNALLIKRVPALRVALHGRQGGELRRYQRGLRSFSDAQSAVASVSACSPFFVHGTRGGIGPSLGHLGVGAAAMATG
jgi:hypothetical protein